MQLAAVVVGVVIAAISSSIVLSASTTILLLCANTGFPDFIVLPDVRFLSITYGNESQGAAG